MRLILFGVFILMFTISYSQVGERKKEGRHVHRNVNRQPKTSPWIYKKTESGIIQYKETSKLFKWTITKNKKSYKKIQLQQNKKREKRRVRGSDVFQKRKYF